MKYRRRVFSEADTERAIALRLNGATWAELGALFDCDYETVRRVAEPGYAEQRARQIAQSRKRESTHNYVSTGNVVVPPHVMLDRNRRVAAARTVTAMLCGDPAPGQSALDKKRGATA